MKKALYLLILPVFLLLAGCSRPASEPAASPPAGEAWYEELPWEEDWSCLTLSDFELEPEGGKAALRELLSARDWTLAEEEAKLPDDLHTVRLWAGEAEPQWFSILESGEVWRQGKVWRPVGEGAGERFLRAWLELRDRGDCTTFPPPLTYSWGEAALTARMAGVYSWRYVTRAGQVRLAQPYETAYDSVPWLDGTYPILRAEGDVTLSFSGREPDALSLFAFSALGSVPVEVRDGSFLPFAGANAYLLTCSWDRTKQGGSGEGAYILLIEGAETCAPQGDAEELALTVTAADAYGCVFTLETRCGEANRRFEYATESKYALLRRNEAGGWEWVKPVRRSQNTYSAALKPGLSRTDAWDWSYVCGPLPPGEYSLLIWGDLAPGPAAGSAVTVRGTFTLEDNEPEGPGPRTLCPCPEWLEESLYSRELKSSGHRWMQVLTGQQEGWAAERDFSLFRLTAEGELLYVPPEYNLSGDLLNWTPVLHPGRTVTFEVELAARYGRLESGQYVLRRRLIRLGEEDPEDMSTLMLPDRRLLPEERLRYVDTEFTLYTLRDVPFAVDPLDSLRDFDSLSTTVLVSTAGSSFSAAGCTLRLKNVDANLWYDVSYESDYYSLYANYQLEWYPAAHTRYGAHGLIWRTLAPGETQELNIDFTLCFGELAPGDYRLVIACRALPYAEEPEKPEGFITVSFRILEDGGGVPAEAEEALHLVGIYLTGGLRDREGGNVRLRVSDLYSRRWDREIREDRLRLTVWQDRDLARAEALLGNYGCVDILRGEDPALQPSPVTEENLGSRGTLSVAPAETWSSVQEPGEPPVLWEYSFTFAREGTGMQTLSVDSVFHVEVLEEGRWFAFTTTREYPPPDFYISERFFEIRGMPGQTVSLGRNVSRLLDLSEVYGEFDPAKEYRVVLRMWEDLRNKEYYTCPLPLWG